VCGNDRSLFLELLNVFLSENGDSVERLRSALEAGDRLAAAARLHTQCGFAGAVGTLEVFKNICELEQAPTESKSDTAPLLEHIAGLISGLIEASAPLARRRSSE
jgi:HPt (histidine-containing phosphotransfer) domain-containing protein